MAELLIKQFSKELAVFELGRKCHYPSSKLKNSSVTDVAKSCISPIQICVSNPAHTKMPLLQPKTTRSDSLRESAPKAV